jgi:hypothetical protein
MWTQYFTCKACKRPVSRSGPDPLLLFDYCLRCDGLEALAEAYEELAVRGEREKLITVARAA